MSKSNKKCCKIKDKTLYTKNENFILSHINNAKTP